jgi:disulfide bond formation protein DsbB
MSYNTIMQPQQVVWALSLLTLISNAVLIYLLLLFIFTRFGLFRTPWISIVSFFKKYALQCALIISLTAMLGSLYFSEIAGFEPCKLCWLQRIFMYPLVILLIVAIRKKAKDVGQYILPLSIIGLIIAGYHYYIQISPVQIIPCSVSGYAASCTERFTTSFGFITIPWMAVTAFVLISLVLSLLSPAKKWFN